jgi:hypothetical protein
MPEGEEQGARQAISRPVWDDVLAAGAGPNIEFERRERRQLDRA